MDDKIANNPLTPVAPKNHDRSGDVFLHMILI